MADDPIQSEMQSAPPPGTPAAAAPPAAAPVTGTPPAAAAPAAAAPAAQPAGQPTAQPTAPPTIVKPVRRGGLAGIVDEMRDAIAGPAPGQVHVDAQGN